MERLPRPIRTPSLRSLAPKDQQDTLKTRLKDAKDAVASATSGTGTATTPGS